jgi:predicted acylesterase/phospholipase RssA/CRP-like cAMP-binding protein
VSNGLQGVVARARPYERTELIELLVAEPVFSQLAADALSDLADAFEVFEVQGGGYLLRAGDRLDALYGVLSGGLRMIRRNGAGGAQVIGEVYRGQMLGVMSMFIEQPMPLDLLVLRDSTLLRLSGAKFLAVTRKHPSLLNAFLRVMSERALDLIEAVASTSRTSRRKGNFALIPISGEAREALSRTVEIMRIKDGATHVTAAMVDDSFGRGTSGGDDPRTAEWLSKLERGQNALLYECDLQIPAWTARCVRQSDRLIIFAAPGDERRIDELVTAIERARNGGLERRIDVVLVHPPTTILPATTRPWLHLPDVDRVFHVRAGERRDYARVARHVMGRPIGVVLSGGGARGIAHLGVLAAILETGIPIDCIAGTSMGAIFAAGFAQGWSIAHMREAVHDIFTPPLALYDFTIPISSLLAGNKLDRVMRKLYGEANIEDLWVPFFCVSTDLSRAKLVVHDRGSLWKSVRASCSIPGMFPAMPFDDRMLVDGGLMDNLPIDLFSECYSGSIIAVDVFPYGDPTFEHPSGPIASLLRRFREWLKREQVAPPLFDILVRSTLVGSKFRQETVMPRLKNVLHLEPPVASFGILRWRAHRALYEAGYQYARAELARAAPAFLEQAI